MRRVPRSALVPLALAGLIFALMIVLSLLPAPKPTWASDPNAGREMRQILCLAPLALIGMALGIAGIIALARAEGRAAGRR